MGDDELPDLAALIEADAAGAENASGCGFCQRRPELAATAARVLSMAAEKGLRLSSRRVLFYTLSQHPGEPAVSDPYFGKHLRYCEPDLWGKVKKR